MQIFGAPSGVRHRLRRRPNLSKGEAIRLAEQLERKIKIAQDQVLETKRRIHEAREAAEARERKRQTSGLRGVWNRTKRLLTRRVF